MRLVTSDRGTAVPLCSHEEETQWNQCIVSAFAAAGCGNLTEAEIAMNCGNINSNSTVCPVRRYTCAPMHRITTVTNISRTRDAVDVCAVV